MHSEAAPQILERLASFPKAMNREEVIRKAIFKPLVLLYLAALGVISFFSFTSFHSRLHTKISEANEYIGLFKKKKKERNAAFLPII